MLSLNMIGDLFLIQVELVTFKYMFSSYVCIWHAQEFLIFFFISNNKTYINY